MNKITIEIKTLSKNIDEIFEWVFQNIEGRFQQYGLPERHTNKIIAQITPVYWVWYFEKESDAVLFKLTWGGQ